MSKGSLAPLTGVAFFLLVVVAIVISGGEPPDTEDPVREIIQFYRDNEGAQIASAIAASIAATALVFFTGYLRRVLRDAEGPGGFLSTVMFGGGLTIAIWMALDSTITFALVETSDDIQPAAVQALSALWANDFVVAAVGAQVFLLALGISAVRHGAVPKWIGWIAIVLGVIAITPAGFVALLGSAILILILSVLLILRARRAPAAAT